MQKPGEIGDVKKKAYARSREALQHGIGNSALAGSSGRNW